MSSLLVSVGDGETKSKKIKVKDVRQIAMRRWNILREVGWKFINMQ